MRIRWFHEYFETANLRNSHKIRINKQTQFQQKKLVEYFDYFFALICRYDMSLTTNRKIMHDPVS